MSTAVSYEAIPHHVPPSFSEKSQEFFPIVGVAISMSNIPNGDTFKKRDELLCVSGLL